MAITQNISAMPTPPNPGTDDSATFSTRATAFTQAIVTLVSQINTWASQANSTQNAMNAASTGAAVAMNTVIDLTSTTAADPGSGKLRFNSATQNASTALYLNNNDAAGVDWSGILATLTGSSSTVKGYLKIHLQSDGTKFIAGTFTAMSSPTGYRNFTFTPLVSSSASPFNNGDAVVFTFSRTGDASTGGSAAISDIVAQTQNIFTTGGTSTAYTGTPNTAIVSYTAGQTFWATFHADSGDQPTLTISGVGTPPNLVKAMPDGSYANIRAKDIIANWRSKVTLLSATQALVEKLPIDQSAAIYPTDTFNADFTFTYNDAGRAKVHPSADTTPRTATIPANASVPFPIGTVLTIVNQNSAGNVSVPITTDTMRLAGSGATGTRTVAPNGIFSAQKITATEWIASGVGVS